MAINLLPQADKEALEWDRRRRALVALLVQLTMGAAMLWLAFVGVEWYLRTETNRIEGELAGQRELLQQSELQQLEVNFQKTVQLAKAVEQVASTVRPVSPVLIEVAELIPSGMELKSVRYSAKDRRVSLLGRAPTRELVVQLEDAIRRRSHYTAIDAPLANLTKPADIDFSFAFTVGKP
ncbi:hypothetical protein HYW67_03905 [Candidatus Parcubacteria bacterium]|nr:hypothetical protein [Candidatus Parcubacteria bacterium]